MNGINQSRARANSALPRLSRSNWVAGLAPLVLASQLTFSCKSDEPPPPLPTPKAAPEPEAPLELKPEDAGLPPVEEKPKTTAKRRTPVGLTQCCKALRQNAASAPEPTKGYMLYAAQLCDGAVAQGQGQSTAIGMIRSALQGAGLPGDCK